MYTVFTYVSQSLTLMYQGTMGINNPHDPNPYDCSQYQG